MGLAATVGTKGRTGSGGSLSEAPVIEALASSMALQHSTTRSGADRPRFIPTVLHRRRRLWWYGVEREKRERKGIKSQESSRYLLCSITVPVHGAYYTKCMM